MKNGWFDRRVQRIAGLLFAGTAVLLTAAAPVVAAQAMCIQAYNIDHTEIKNDSVILFHMRNGTTYQNALPNRCFGLKSATNGFTYSPTNPATDELCDNLGTFRVNDPPGGGQTCFFGAFTKLS